MSDDLQHAPNQVSIGQLPLSALLSQALVAYTVEADNEFEHQMPHRTASFGSTDGRGTLWLTSLAMWENCLRYLTPDGVTISELHRQARLATNLDGMRRWGYITIEPGVSGGTSKKPRADAVLRPTRAGLHAQEVWRPIPGEIERRWRERFGEGEIDRLRQALWEIMSQVKYALPEFLPILGYGLFTRGRRSSADRVATMQDEPETQPPAPVADVANLPLSALLAKALLVFAVQFERESNVSLAISADVLRVLGAQDVQVRDLRRLSGISKESLSMALGFLEDRELAIVGPDSSGSRYKVVRLTPKGLEAKEMYLQLVEDIEQRWRVRYGEQSVARLREALEPLVGLSDANSPLFQGLQPYPDGWRAKIARPETLPYFPMVLHRGGYPDGA